MNCSVCGGWGAVRRQQVNPYGHRGEAVTATLPVSVIPKDDLIYRTMRESMPKAQFRFCAHCAGTGRQRIEPKVLV